MELQFAAVARYFPHLLEGLWVTVLVSVATCVLSLALGLGLAIAQVSGARWLRWLCGIYTDVFRNTPFLVQLFFFYFGLPELGILIGPVETGIMALSLATAASNAEVIRAGIETVDRGIVEAARAFALSSGQVFRFVILPIALRISWRPLGSVLVNMVLTTSVLSTITVNDLMGNANTVSSTTFRPFEVYLTVLVLYCFVTFTLSAVINIVQALLLEPRQR
jgi:polar amino acid transport system permease protein/putative glutamine transport system permease protein